MTKPLTMSEEREAEIRKRLTPNYPNENQVLRELDATREALAKAKRDYIDLPPLHNYTRSLEKAVSSKSAELERVTKERDEARAWNKAQKIALAGLLRPILADIRNCVRWYGSQWRVEAVITKTEVLDLLRATNLLTDQEAIALLHSDPRPEPQGAAQEQPRCHVCGTETIHHAAFCSFRGDPKDMKSPVISFGDRVKALLDAAKAPAPLPGEFGEPWTHRSYNDSTYYDRNGKWILDDEHHDRYMPRAVICVNALSGIPDPEAFVRAAKGAIPLQFAADTKVISGREWAAVEALYKIVGQLVKDARRIADRPDEWVIVGANSEIADAFDALAAIRGEGK